LIRLGIERPALLFGKKNIERLLSVGTWEETRRERLSDQLEHWPTKNGVLNQWDSFIILVNVRRFPLRFREMSVEAAAVAITRWPGSPLRRHGLN
jgi:hypothetical protein